MDTTAKLVKKDRVKPPARVGRPSKLTPEIQATVVQYVRGGNYFSVACRAAGLSYATFQEWMSRGEDKNADPAKPPTPEFEAFARSIRKAEADAEASSITLIRTAARTSWQAAAWYLERKYPDRYGRRERISVGGDDDAPPIRTESKAVVGHVDLGTKEDLAEIITGLLDAGAVRMEPADDGSGLPAAQVD